VIDARYIGGMARFANHSCSPNCTIERWEVAGETCCGIFAKRTICAGEEITIRYGKGFVLPEVSYTHNLKSTYSASNIVPFPETETMSLQICQLHGIHVSCDHRRCC